ncbi:hypothetical protein WMY93_014143 [Mugilogobius chulae]|uniref:DDE Tnp4 domain-containing protein n=1 Tax=Mugilogobius chulae TaxID=88201 RepID=A0AAW0NUH5_9GOBI
MSFSLLLTRLTNFITKNNLQQHTGDNTSDTHQLYHEQHTPALPRATVRISTEVMFLSICLQNYNTHTTPETATQVQRNALDHCCTDDGARTRAGDEKRRAEKREKTGGESRRRSSATHEGEKEEGRDRRRGKEGEKEERDRGRGKEGEKEEERDRGRGKEGEKAGGDRYLATGDSFATLSFGYRLGQTTVRNSVHMVCNAIEKNMMKKFLQPPNEEAWREIAEGFWSKWNFPNCLGALDGKHVEIEKPPHSGSQYFNYMKFFSIVLLALVDADYRFRIIHVGDYGRSSDGGVYAASALGIGMERGSVHWQDRMV